MVNGAGESYSAERYKLPSTVRPRWYLTLLIILVVRPSTRDTGVLARVQDIVDVDTGGDMVMCDAIEPQC